MHASIVVLSAFVAVASGQWMGGYWGGAMPINPYLGVPMDEPAVMAGKVFNAQQHAIRGSPTYVVRKRREAAPQEAPAAPAAAADAAAEPQPEKRQVLAYSGLGYLGGWGNPYYGWGGYNAYPYLFRKRRDVSEDTPAAAPEHAAAMDESPKEKRQIGFFGGWGGVYSPYMRAGWGGIYGGYPYLFRKRRSVGEETPAAAEQAPMDESKDKRQVFGLGYGYGGYGWGYPSAYSGIYSPWGRSAFLWRKRRSTDSEAAAPAQEQEQDTATQDERNKRQLLIGAPLAYSAYNPYMMGYSGWHGLGYRGYW